MADIPLCSGDDCSLGLGDFAASMAEEDLPPMQGGKSFNSFASLDLQPEFSSLVRRLHLSRSPFGIPKIRQQR